MDTLLPWVALVDDEESVRRALLRLLRSANIPASCYANGANLLAALPDGAPCCVVLDINMPGMSGLEVQQRLAALAPQAGVIIMSGHHTPEEQSQAMRHGALAYLPKPVNDLQLLAAISTACQALARRQP